jgi:hypothetical protein
MPAPERLAPRRRGVDGEVLEALGHRINPAREVIWAKIVELEDALDGLPHATDAQLAACRESVAYAKACCARRFGHSHLAWRFLHRVDADLLLLLPDDQILARAVDLKSSFDFSVSEPTLRTEWLGDASRKGRLTDVVEQLESAMGDQVTHLPARHALREAAVIVNDLVDRGFWRLSMNVLTTLYSAILLVGVMVLLAVLWAFSVVPPLAVSSEAASLSFGSEPARDMLLMALVGVMGTYLSNLLATKDFLFVPGGPFLRFLLHPLLTLPVLGAFSATVVYAVVHSGLLISIGTTSPGGAVAFTATHATEGYVYAVVALVSGFAADRVLGNIINSVLRRLEQKAEKTVKPKAEEASG